MRLIIMYLILTIMPLGAFANGRLEYCDQVTSQKIDDRTYAICGVGYGAGTQEFAKNEAWENAKSQYLQLCQRGTSCWNKNVTINPQRTVCVRIPYYDAPWGYSARRDIKCTRLFYFSYEN